MDIIGRTIANRYEIISKNWSWGNGNSICCKRQGFK